MSFSRSVLMCCVVIEGATDWGSKGAGKTIETSVIAKNLDKGAKAVVPLLPHDIEEMMIVEKEIGKEKETSKEKK